MSQAETISFYPSDRKQWRKWLQQNHETTQSVWLICYKKKAVKPTISWSDAVDEALCFGWIDSVRRSVDDETFMQFFSKRKPGSTWSKVNKEKVEVLIKNGHMAQAGLNSITVAKQNGSWTILDEVEAMIIPDDLETAFLAQPGSKEFFMTLSRSVRKVMLQWIVLAKQESTRQKRIMEVAVSASRQQKPGQF